MKNANQEGYIQERTSAWIALRSILVNLSETEFNLLAKRAEIVNPWFTIPNIKLAWQGIIDMLDETKLVLWLNQYRSALLETKSLSIGIVMAGNIPMVGFHDLLCVTLAGHAAQVKTSAQDEILIKWIIKELNEIAPDLANKISFVDRLLNYDAVIATGSNNSSRYFEYYFKHVPHIIRKNRHSVAILSGKESEEELVSFGHDIFDYFGHGCRNVSKVYLPVGYPIPTLLDLWHDPFHELIFHNKYANNYQYNRAIYLLDSKKFLDTGYLILKESDDLAGPLSVLNYAYYEDLDTLALQLEEQKSEIQCIVGNVGPATIPFGQTQRPGLADYADGVDTMYFLTSL